MNLATSLQLNVLFFQDFSHFPITSPQKCLHDCRCFLSMLYSCALLTRSTSPRFSWARPRVCQPSHHRGRNFTAISAAFTAGNTSCRMVSTCTKTTIRRTLKIYLERPTQMGSAVTVTHGGTTCTQNTRPASWQNMSHCKMYHQLTGSSSEKLLTQTEKR